MAGVWQVLSNSRCPLWPPAGGLMEYSLLRATSYNNNIKKIPSEESRLLKRPACCFVPNYGLIIITIIIYIYYYHDYYMTNECTIKSLLVISYDMLEVHFSRTNLLKFQCNDLAESRSTQMLKQNTKGRRKGPFQYKQ